MARIKNWSKFQHFKDRRPPWIKLYREILDDREWHKLDGESAKLLTMLWLLASENDGELPSIDDIAFRVRLPESTVKALLPNLSHWLEQSDITMISELYQDDLPETETETETETKTEEEEEEEIETDLPPSEVGETGKPVCPPCPIDEIVKTYHESLPTLPRFLVRNDTRDGYIRARWRQFYEAGDFTDRGGGLDCFRWFFAEKVKPSKFLTGMSEGKQGQKPFVADLEWLMRPTNFAKVIEGKYS